MTAVEWLAEQLEEKGKVSEHTKSRILEFKIDVSDYLDLKRQAKEMEKQQIIDAYKIGECEVGLMIVNKPEQYYNETYGSKGSYETLKENHIVDTNEMVKKGTLKKRMDKDSWFVVFQSNAYNEIDMAYELLKSQEIDIDMYDVYKDGDEVTFEVVNKKWAKITPFLYPFKTTSSQTEISDEEIFYQKQVMNPYPSTKHLYTAWEKGFMECAKWYREQLKIKQNEINNTKL